MRVRQRRTLATSSIRRSTAGCVTSFRSATLVAVARRRRHVLRQVVGADGEECRRREALRHDGHGRHLDHDAERRARGCDVLRRPDRSSAASRRAAAAAISLGHRHHRQHDFQVAARRGAGERAKLDAKTSGRASDRRMPRRPRNGFCSSTRQALHRLVAAGIDGADRDRPARRPNRAPWRRRGTASPRREASSPVKRNSVRISPTPSQVATSMHVELLRSRDVDHDADARAVGGAAPAGRCGAPRSSPLRERRRGARARASRCAWPGLEHDGAPRRRPTNASAWPSSSIAPRPTTIGTPRERASIATWLAALPPESAMPPPADQSVSRKRVGVTSSPTRIAPGGSASVRRAGEVAQHAVAQVGEVGGAGAKIVVVRRLHSPRSRAASASRPRGVCAARRRRSPRAPGRSARRRRAWRPGIPGSRRSPLRLAPSAARSARSTLRSPPRAQRAPLAGSPVGRRAADRRIEADERAGGDARAKRACPSAQPVPA